MAYGNYALHTGISGIADRMRENKTEDAKLTKLLATVAPDADQTGMNLDQKRAAWDQFTLQEGMKTARQKLKDAQAARQLKQAQAAQMQAQTAGLQEEQRYAAHQRDQAAEQQAADTRYLKPYAQVMDHPGGRAKAPDGTGGIPAAAAARYQAELQQNPNLQFAARYMDRTGQMPGAESMARYAPPPVSGGEETFTPKMHEIGGRQVIQTGPKTSQVVDKPQPRVPTEEQMVQNIMQNLGVGYGEALVLYSRLKSGLLSPGQLPQGATPPISGQQRSLPGGGGGTPPPPQF